jgi:circadian clock protein KaiB
MTPAKTSRKPGVTAAAAKPKAARKGGAGSAASGSKSVSKRLPVPLGDMAVDEKAQPQSRARPVKTAPAVAAREAGLAGPAVDVRPEFERALAEADTARYVLRLYVTGFTPQSSRAIQNIKRICEEYLQGRYDLEVVDIYQQPALAKGEQIIAAPTLIKKLPLPLRRIIGDLSNTERVLLGLDLRLKAK